MQRPLAGQRENDHEQADSCRDRTAAILARSLHVALRVYLSRQTLYRGTP